MGTYQEHTADVFVLWVTSSISIADNICYEARQQKTRTLVVTRQRNFEVWSLQSCICKTTGEATQNRWSTDITRRQVHPKTLRTNQRYKAVPPPQQTQRPPTLGYRPHDQNPGLRTLDKDADYNCYQQLKVRERQRWVWGYITSLRVHYVRTLC